ncbi:transposase [Desulfovibrio sulfodismutans]|uniref:Transposase n=1 Tax=Desulfolutivibrio sulfodismutans TaxID=63561 RepID=A0A7K3NQ63_9BACT|nr:transposase [Desulfolutivibrio sulfodismutans]QLA14623.1 hypothetical protein GD606_19950 [Desulfolutivibrio sulfodismutans DSM 3696]
MMEFWLFKKSLPAFPWQAHRERMGQEGHRLKETKYRWLSRGKDLPDTHRPAIAALAAANLKVAKVWAMKENLNDIWKRLRSGLARRFATGVIHGKPERAKHDHCMARNFLKGVLGDAINLLMAAAAFHFRKWMRMVAQIFALILSSLWGKSKGGISHQAIA